MHKRGRSLDGGDIGGLNSGTGHRCEGEKEGCTGLEGTVPPAANSRGDTPLDKRRIVAQRSRKQGSGARQRETKERLTGGPGCV
jgi:hypothetical protein